MKDVARLNNRKLRALRKSEIYEAVLTDLYLIGALEQEVVEKIIGHKVHEHLTSPLEDIVEEDDDIVKKPETVIIGDKVYLKSEVENDSTSTL